MATSLADNIVQCWGCAVFDRLFQIISTIGIEIYDSMTQICLVIFGLLFAIFVFNAIWKNFKGGIKDPIMKDSFLKAFIRAVFALTLLGAGTLVPITGFANAVASPAVEYKAEGFIMGVGAKIFTIAGPVILYGTAAGVVYGVVYWLTALI